MSIQTVRGCPAGLVMVDGKVSILERIFVTADEGLVPKVVSVDLYVYGKDFVTGEERHEQILAR